MKALHAVHRTIFILLLSAMLVIAVFVLAAMVHDMLHGNGVVSGAGILQSSIDTATRKLHASLILHSAEAFCVTLVVALMAALFLWLELRHLLRRKPRLVLSRGNLGEVAISLDQVGMLAQYEAETVDGVREVHTIAEPGKHGVQVRQTVAVEANRQLPSLAEEIQERVKRSLEYHLGFPVASVQVALRQSSITKTLT